MVQPELRLDHFIRNLLVKSRKMRYNSNNIVFFYRDIFRKEEMRIT